MKFIASRLELVKMIGTVQGVVANRPTLPILANVLLEAVDQQLLLSATDLTVSMRSHGQAQILEQGAIALPARRFFQLIRELNTAQIELQADEGRARLTAGSSSFTLHGMRSDEFPPFPALDQNQILEMEGKDLKEVLTRSAFAAAREDHRQVLNALLMETDQQKSAWIGTDGKRLAKVEAAIGTNQPSTAYIIPLKAVEEMIKALDDNKQSVKLHLNAGTIALESNTLLIVAKLLAGEYPDIAHVIPEQPKEVIALHREELISLLRQVALFTSESRAAVRFTFLPNELQLAAASSEIGEGKVSMPVNYQGEKLEIAFNPTYFLDILRHSRDESVLLGISDSYNPGLVTDSSTAKFVIMPMRLD